MPDVSDAPPNEDDVDYRFTLANERTFLAWLRTALGLLAAAVAVQQVPVLRPAWTRTALSLLCVALSLLASVGGVLHWRAVERAMRRARPLPPLRLAWALALGLVLLAVVAGSLLLADQRA